MKNKKQKIFLSTSWTAIRDFFQKISGQGIVDFLEIISKNLLTLYDWWILKMIFQ